MASLWISNKGCNWLQKVVVVEAMRWVVSEVSLFSWGGSWVSPPRKFLKFELLGALRPIVGGKLNDVGGLTLNKLGQCFQGATVQIFLLFLCKSKIFNHNINYLWGGQYTVSLNSNSWGRHIPLSSPCEFMPPLSNQWMTLSSIARLLHIHLLCDCFVTNCRRF